MNPNEIYNGLKSKCENSARCNRYATYWRGFMRFIMKLIKLTQGKFAQVDDEDYDYLNQWKWYAKKCQNLYYAARGVLIEGKMKSIYMHRIIMNTSFDLHTDHLDRNTLNNQKSNLRICSMSQNMSNRKMKTGSETGFLGVHYRLDKRNKNKAIKLIVAEITANNKHFYLGLFKTEIEAALAYDRAAVRYHGEFANLNFK